MQGMTVKNGTKEETRQDIVELFVKKDRNVFYAAVRSYGTDRKIGECKGQMPYSEINYFYLAYYIIKDNSRLP